MSVRLPPELLKNKPFVFTALFWFRVSFRLGMAVLKFDVWYKNAVPVTSLLTCAQSALCCCIIKLQFLVGTKSHLNEPKNA